MSDEFSSYKIDESRGKSLGKLLQGVQHVGVTVDDMKKSLEFYIEVLGGRLAIAGSGFYGPVLHNTLFQVEDIEAYAHHSSPRSYGVPDLRDGTKDAIDVCFISFGNTCVELIHFREAHLDVNAPNIFPRLPSGVGHGNACHISFHVKDDVDLNVFAKQLENECQRRGISNVKVNHVIDVKTDQERRSLPLKYAANKFWNEMEYFIEGYSDANFGDFEGWSLFYAKGPNGEQLEFNQVTRVAKKNFDRARNEYNQANDTSYEPPRPTKKTEQEPLPTA
jgi:catechol 2,3-dioxygenase-like lactoylglutathione lyase family enzyme